jgi:broad specificity phosphatase PhoE
MTDEARTYLFVSALEPLAAAAAVWSAPAPPDLCVTSPSAQARATAAFAAAGHYLRRIDEPLLAARAPHESAADVAARYAEALRVLHALASTRTLVVVDELPLNGRGGPHELDDAALLHAAERIERELPTP